MAEADPETPPARRYPATPHFPTGPSLGAPFPEVKLADQHGDEVDLHAARGGRRAVIVFHRSAQWCAFCRRQLTQVQEALAAFEGAGVAVFAISPDLVPHLAEFAHEAGITYPMLSDEGSNLIRDLGILNDLIRPDEPRYGIPFPGVYVLDEAGTVLRKYFYQHYRERPHPLFILQDALGVAVDEATCTVTTAGAGDTGVRAVVLGRGLTPYEHTRLLIASESGRPFRARIEAAPSVILAPASPSSVGASEQAVEIWTTSMDDDSVHLELTLEFEDSQECRLEIAVPVQRL